MNAGFAAFLSVLDGTLGPGRVGAGAILRGATEGGGVILPPFDSTFTPVFSAGAATALFCWPPDCESMSTLDTEIFGFIIVVDCCEVIVLVCCEVRGLGLPSDR